jgi:hypothetical protein
MLCHDRTGMPRFYRPLALLLIASFCVAPAAYSTEDDAGGWAALVASGRFDNGSGKLLYHVDAQARYFDIGSGINQWLIRPGIGYDLGNKVSVWLGYSRFRTRNRAGVVVDENRPWQDIRFSPVFSNGHRLNLRLRFEQRLIDASDDARMVLRLMARYTIPVGESSRLFFGVEPFYDLNTTDWGGGRGRSQDRAFIGMGWPLGKRMSIEATYMQQLFKFDGREDLLNHLGVVTLRF